MKNKLKICIVDDKLPYNEEVDDSFLIDSKGIKKIVLKNKGWLEEKNLLYLITLILNSELFSKELIEIHWATNPNIILNAIKDTHYCPDIIIYDWEYGTSFMVPEDTLSELLELLPNSFFFIYSSYAQKIPIHLFKKQLDKYASRFQVLLKGDNSYVANTEEIIFEYISLRIEKNPIIKIGGVDVHFQSSGFLSDYKDILYLDNLIGRDAITKGLSNLDNILSERTASSLLDNMNLKIYASIDEKILTLDDNKTNTETFGDLIEISNSHAYRLLGLKKLKQLVEKGIVKV